MELISVRERPHELNRVIDYFQRTWGKESTLNVYADCIRHCLNTGSPLPQWYLLAEGSRINGGAGLINNDFICRMDLYPWICALFIEEEFRGHAYGNHLLEKGRLDAKADGFHHVYLCTDHVGYYEKYGFNYLTGGFQPWGETSRIYSSAV